MPTFVSLVNWTDQGIKNYRDSVRRAEDYRGLVEQNGGQVRQLVWTLGEYDVVAVTDFPDDETATAVALQIGALGNIRTTTMKAFDAEQMSAIIQRTGYGHRRHPPTLGPRSFAGTGMAGAGSPTGGLRAGTPPSQGRTAGGSRYPRAIPRPRTSAV